MPILQINTAYIVSDKNSAGEEVPEKETLWKEEKYDNPELGTEISRKERKKSYNPDPDIQLKRKESPDLSGDSFKRQNTKQP